MCWRCEERKMKENWAARYYEYKDAQGETRGEEMSEEGQSWQVYSIQERNELLEKELQAERANLRLSRRNAESLLANASELVEQIEELKKKNKELEEGATAARAELVRYQTGKVEGLKEALTIALSMLRGGSNGDD